MARDFATNDFLSFGEQPGLDVAAQNFSVTFKCIRDASGVIFVGAWGSGGDFQWLITAGTADTITQFNNSGAVHSAGEAIPTTGWHTVGLSFDDVNNTGTLYVDGIAESTVAVTQVLGPSQSVLEIGRAAAAAFSDGKIAEFAIWIGGAILTPAEHAAIHAGVNPLTISPDSLRAYVPIWGTSSPERDYSGRGHHATLQGTPDAFTQHPPVMPHVIPVRSRLHSAGTSIITDEAEVYLNLQALVTEEFPHLYLDLQASGVETLEKLDAATVLLDLQASGIDVHAPPCFITGDGEARTRWIANDATIRFSAEAEERWLADVLVGTAQC